MDDAARMASFDECFEHQAWVRSLAVRLCGNSAAADDLAQDAWVEVARGTSAARSSRAWLGGVVRNLARRTHRRDEARSAREARAAREAQSAGDDDVPSADSLLAQAELQRRVLSAVASLDEAHRMVVLMRYYDGCDGEEIAKRLGVPSSTVRNRLARAHEKLRLKLDGEYGERATWSVLFAPALVWKSSTGAAAGVGIAMKVQAAIATAVVLVAAVLFWSRFADSHEAASVPITLVAATAEPLAPNLALADARSAVDSGGQVVAATPSNAEPFLVFGDMRGVDDGLKLERGKLSFVNARGTSREATFGAANSYSIFGLKPGAYRITSWVRGYVPLDEDVLLPDGETKLRHDIVLTKSLVLPVTFVERGSGAVITPKLTGWESGLGAVATRERPTSISGVVSRAPTSYGIGTWYANDGTRKSLEDGSTARSTLEIWEPGPVFVSCVLRDLVLETRLIRGDERELVFELDRAAIEGKLASLALRCVDATTGQPIEGAQVRACPTDGLNRPTSTDENGAVRIERIAPGLQRVWIEAEGFGPVLRWQHFDAGAKVDLETIGLLPSARLRGRIVGMNGSQVEGVCARLYVFAPHDDVAARDLQAPYVSESSEDGSFTIGDVASERLRLVAVDEEWAIGALDVDASRGAADGLELRLERGVEVSLDPPRSQRTVIEVAIVDGAGLPLLARGVYPTGGRHFRLARGHYELHTLVDKRVVRRQAFEVGDEPLSIEVAPP